MFTNYSWPKSKSRHIRLGRPVQKSQPHQPSRTTYCFIDQLLSKQIINDTQYNSALWVHKAYVSYLGVIEAPRLKTTCLNPLDLKGNNISAAKLVRINNNWNKVLKVIEEYPTQKKSAIFEFINLEPQISDIPTIKSFLDNIYNAFKSFSCKNNHPAVKKQHD